MTRVDAHVHLWDLDRCHYPWLTPALGALHRTFTPQEAHTELDRAGFETAVLVQAADSHEETAFLLEIAAAEPWVAGVVGWLPLADPSATAAGLASRTAAHVGVRHLTHDDPDPEFLMRPAVQQSLRLLSEEGVPLDVPDAWPGQLGQLPFVADHCPGLVVVVDHLGKPPVGTDRMPYWAAALREVAARPGTVAKLSGLVTIPGASPWGTSVVEQAVDVALEAFGPDRLMVGSDWPMPLRLSPNACAQSWQVLLGLVDRLAPDERAAVLGGTAARVYGLAS